MLLKGKVWTEWGSLSCHLLHCCGQHYGVMSSGQSAEGSAELTKILLRFCDHTCEGFICGLFYLWFEGLFEEYFTHPALLQGICLQLCCCTFSLMLHCMLAPELCEPALCERANHNLSQES